MNKILVTGSSGTIGRELLCLLKDTGDILAIDRVEPEERLDGIRYYTDDICTVHKMINEFNPDIVYHLAASFERVKETPEFYIVNKHDNLDAFHCVLENTHPQVFVYPSSYLVYRIDENGYLHSDIQPRNLIGSVKYYCERELEYYQKTHWRDTQIIIGRIYRSYGCGSRDVISRWIRSLLRDKPIELYGENTVLSYIYAADVALALSKLVEGVSEKFEVIDICDPAPCLSMGNIAKIVLQRLDKIPKLLKYVGNDKEVPERHLKCQNNCFINPTPIHLRAGIDKVIEYERGKL
jgi:nucleoside-diphosphate-sugar epimerase